MIRPSAVLIGLALVLGTDLAAASPDLHFSQIWCRLPAPGMHSSAAYLTIKNSSDHTITLDKVSSKGVRSAGFHHNRQQQGRMQMMADPTVAVPAHGQLDFAPGQRHIMLMGLQHALQEGDSIPLTLHDGQGNTYRLSCPVRWNAP